MHYGRTGPRQGFVLLAALLLLSACGSGGRDAGSAVAGNDPGLVHIHGLAVDPDDDEIVYVATHLGLFRTEGEQIRRVGEAMHDLMGFTIAGPGDFLASGHPDLRVEELQVPGKPPLLGLVHSRDGESWQSVSLLGEVDFHALAVAHDQVSGYDSTNGRFMVSQDRLEWETRSEIELVDFAVSPHDPDTVVAATENALVRSSDGGRTWGPLSTQPYAFFSWSRDELYAVTPDGALVVSRDEGATWEKRGQVGGEPEALLAMEDRVLVAVRGVGIVESDDRGETFDVRVRVPARRH